MNGLVPVRVRDCACPDGPHEDPAEGPGDFVYMAPTASLAMGIACGAAAGLGDPTAQTIGFMEAFVRHGARDANFMDPFDAEALIADNELGSPVAAKGQELYLEAVLRPLGLSLSNREQRRSSQRGRTAGSTSRTRQSRRTSPRSSSASSSAGAR